MSKKYNEEERTLLAKMSSGVLDGVVGNSITTSGGSSVWTAIKQGIPTQYKQGPGGRFFNGKENERFEGKLHILREWKSEDMKIEFLQKYGWLLDDSDARSYSYKYKPKK